MARRIREADLQAIEEVVGSHPGGVTARQIAESLQDAPAHRTLQYRLKSLVERKRLVMLGSGRRARYHAPVIARVAMQVTRGDFTAGFEATVLLPLSEAGTEVRGYVRRPAEARAPVGYDPALLESYRPNETFYLSEAERRHLRDVGTSLAAAEPAGTHARQVLNRLLIDLSWNSSRLEGNTYSLLDTKRLLEAGAEAEGKDRRDAQMILNHKEAIEFLVEGAAEIGFNRHTILNLHAALADNLLPDPEAEGRLRQGAVGIQGSVFYPLEGPQRIEAYFDRFLATASAIVDPSEQALFALVQLPYLQPFDDVNKRVVAPRREHPPHQGESVAALLRGRVEGPIHGGRSGRLRAQTGSSFSATCSSGPTNALPPVTPPSANRWESPIPFGCATGRRCASSSLPSCGVA